MREGLVFEVADRELDDGVLAVLGLDECELVGAVGRERVVLPARAATRPARRASEHGGRSAATAELGLGDLRDRRWGSPQRCPVVLGDRLDRGADVGLQADADRELPARS